MEPHIVVIQSELSHFMLSSELALACPLEEIANLLGQKIVFLNEYITVVDFVLVGPGFFTGGGPGAAALYSSLTSIGTITFQTFSKTVWPIQKQVSRNGAAGRISSL